MACLKEPDSETEIARREVSKNYLGLYSHLPNCVSHWERYHVENFLHIYYEKNSSKLSDVLEKIPKINNLSSQQKKYIEILKNTNFGPNIGLKRTAYAHSKTTELLDEAVKELKASIPIINSSLTSENGSLIYTRMKDYITVLRWFVNTSHQKSKTYTVYAKSLFKTPFISEETYTRIVSAFAAMCGLRIENGTADNPAVWDNLRGIGKLVISKPDFRFHCTGEDFSDVHSNLFTVIKVKNKGQYAEEEKLKRKQQEDSEKRAKRRRYTVSSSSSSTPTSPTESDEHRCYSEALKQNPLQTEKSFKPRIEIDVGMHTLGQHAGELLLDLHNYMERHSDVKNEKPSTLTMPGMIIDKTMVYITLLEMSYQHYEKLARAEQLTSEDRATIYYSAPHSIFDKEDSFILFNTMVYLNNIKSIMKWDKST
ncbi:uncharacterized protein LOC127713089 [Mytilus californianus]|uniref:uncharacterized protein LOC127713089 n=1 Tax=Mytilus californianus TaxID=6549 RepID=UPI002245E416|nr:uncharacterized protein LOC127713089 [Mytilus californianus]